MRRGWSWAVLIAVLVLDVWLRGHAFGPAIRSGTGVDPYLATSDESEPLDCDEAIYGHIGKRLTEGAVMYRDLTENKPPGGYWLFALAVALGGPTELTIRVMPLPFVLATLVLVWRVAGRAGGGVAGAVAALTFALLSTDPYLYGESANMEHMINFFRFGALAAFLRHLEGRGRSWLIACGALVGASVLIKQTSALDLPLYAVALWFRSGESEPSGRARGRASGALALGAGFGAVVLVAAAVIVVQGAGRQAFEDVFRYGRALATETPPPPNAPPFLVRWFTGNADPEGRLPWPFGKTNYLVWWGTGTWPIWLAGAAGVGWLALGKSTTPARRTIALMTLASWVEVALPGLFWQHYYLLPVPFLATAFGVRLADGGTARGPRRWVGWPVAGLFGLALMATAWLQVSGYLRVPPADLVNVRGGPQWLVNRSLGREIGRRSAAIGDASLFVWGWQGPLYFYSGLDGVTPQVFVDDFLQTFAEKGHPLVDPRLERTMRDLSARPPTVIFAGYPPFPALRRLLTTEYLPSRLAPGLWVRRDVYGRFETGSAN